MPGYKTTSNDNAQVVRPGQHGHRSLILNASCY